MNNAERRKVEAEFAKLRALPGVLASLTVREQQRDEVSESFRQPSIKRIDAVNEACRAVCTPR